MSPDHRLDTAQRGRPVRELASESTSPISGVISVSAATDRRHRLVAVLGLTGAALGIVAGAVQATVGPRIPEWTGAKASPVALGLLTIGLSALAGFVAVRQGDGGLSVRARIACALGLIGPGLLCLSTVGRLWYPSAVLLLVAGTLTIDSWRDSARSVADDWFRVLLTALGGFEILMAAGAAPVLMVVGAVGGIALISAAWLRPAPRRVLVGLVVVGTVPFAVLAWTAAVPLLLAATAFAVAIPVVRQGFPHVAAAGGAR
jgi:hypothetical protein